MNTVKKDYSMLPGVSLKGVELFFFYVPYLLAFIRCTTSKAR